MSVFLAALGTLLCIEGKAQQLSFKTEYLGNSGYYFLPPGEKPKEKIGDARGSAVVYQGAFNMPLSVKLNENNRPTAWGIGLGGSYTSLNNKNFTDHMVSEIMNLQVGLYHLRPLNDKWSMRASAGVAVLAPSADFSKIRFKNVLGSGGVIFIRHLKPNLSIGGGVAINSSLGYPMIFPAVYLNWHLDGKERNSFRKLNLIRIPNGVKVVFACGSSPNAGTIYTPAWRAMCLTEDTGSTTTGPKAEVPAKSTLSTRKSDLLMS